MLKIKLNTEYTPEETEFLHEHGCETLSEIKLPNCFDREIPKRVFIYGGAYIGEIKDGDRFVWAVLSKFKGKYLWGECYSDLKALGEGF